MVDRDLGPATPARSEVRGHAVQPGPGVIGRSTCGDLDVKAQERLVGEILGRLEVPRPRPKEPADLGTDSWYACATCSPGSTVQP